jgi:hypothetical protein
VALHDPIVISLPLVTMLAVTRMNAVLRESDTDHRGAAVLDGLTGMLNRTALATRTAEIEHQSRERPVGRGDRRRRRLLQGHQRPLRTRDR